MNTRYSPSHEWIRTDGDGFRIGLSAFAANEIGEVAHVELPQPGARVQAGELLGEVESVKSINEVIAPVSGLVQRVNTRLYDDPGLLNRDPEGDGWLVIVAEVTDGDLEHLLDGVAYQQRIDAGG